MAIIASINITTRRIQLDTGVVALNDVLAFWREYRGLRVLDTSLVRQSLPVMSIIGGQSKGGGKYVGRIINLAGYKIIPDDVNHNLDVTIEIIDSASGLSGRNVFDRTTLTADVNIDINIAPVEVITVSSGSGLSTEEHDKLMTGLEADIWKNTDDPATVDSKAGQLARADINTQGV